MTRKRKGHCASRRHSRRLSRFPHHLRIRSAGQASASEVAKLDKMTYRYIYAEISERLAARRGRRVNPGSRFPHAIPLRRERPEFAMGCVRSGSHVVTAMAAAEPQEFFKRIASHCASLDGVEVSCANPSAAYEAFTRADLVGRLELRVMFLTKHVRALQGRGAALHYIPQHLSQWAKHLRERRPIDVFWGSCSLPDANGFVNLGPSACYELECLLAAKEVVLEVNPNLPAVLGATAVHKSQVTHFVEAGAALPAQEREEADEVDCAIAERIAEMVPDGATIQLGIGSLPNAIGAAFREKRDLGVHTELVSDALMDLMKQGVVTGLRKTLWPGKAIGSFAFGSRDLYDYLHLNSAFEFHPAALVNDSAQIGKNSHMISINSAVEVDITGQVCSESVGHLELSGVGGAYETHVGAQRSDGGLSIIALRSTTATGQRSKIVFELQPGAKVSISRNDVDTVVTEYGVACLRGRSVAERAVALAEIAAPQFREELLKQARAVGYV